MEDLLAQVTKRENRYLNEMQTRRVSPSPDDIANLKYLDVPSFVSQRMRRGYKDENPDYKGTL